MSVNVDVISETIKYRIIEYILASPLNINSIPDDVEREIYNQVLDVLNQVLSSEIITKKCPHFINRFCVCGGKKKKKQKGD